LQETPIQQPSEAAAEQLRMKFPARKTLFPESSNSTPAFPSLTVEQLRAVASRMNHHAAPGPSGMPVWMFTYPLISHDPSTVDNEFAELLCRYFDDIAAGTLLAGTGLTEGNLLALVKPDTSLRPVVMPEVDHRFLGRVLLNAHIDAIRSYFGDLQFSLAAGGTEKVVHFVNSYFRTYDDAFLIQLDLANAFNELSRTSIRSALVDRFPAFVKFFDLMHAGCYTVHFGDFTIDCWEGVLQGDPLGPTYFSLGIHSILLELQQEFPEFTFKFYSDDGNILCRRSSVLDSQRIAQLFSTAAEKFQTAGLRIRLDKCAIYSPHFDVDNSIFHPDQLASCSYFGTSDSIRIVSCDEGVTVLGTPLGSDEFVNRSAMKCVQLIAARMRKLEKIRGLKQEYLLLLRQCFNTSFHHLCRTVSPTLLAPAALVHDNNVNIRLQRIIPDLPLVQINDSWDQWALPYRRARLPVRLGGLGLTAASSISHSAYVASVGTSWSSLGAFSSSLLDCVRPSLSHLVDATAPVTSSDLRFPSQLALDLLKNVERFSGVYIVAPRSLLLGILLNIWMRTWHRSWPDLIRNNCSILSRLWKLVDCMI
jgi:hypothetical protein